MSWLSTEFYFYKASAPCRAVWMTIKALNVDAEEKPVDLLKAENKRPWFIRVSIFIFILSILNVIYFLLEFCYSFLLFGSW